MKMVWGVCASCLTAFTLGAASQIGQDDKPTIPLGELYSTDIIGIGGVPLGTVVEVEATIVSGDSLRMKAYAGVYLLRILSVNGVETSQPGGVDRFSVLPMIEARIANNPFGLYELKHREKASRLNSDLIEALEEGYVGQHVHLLVYQTGGFNGIPQGLPDGFPTWQGTEFGFESRLLVVKQFE